MCIKCKPDTEVSMLQGKNTPTHWKLKCLGNRAMKKLQSLEKVRIDAQNLYVLQEQNAHCIKIRDMTQLWQ